MSPRDCRRTPRLQALHERSLFTNALEQGRVHFVGRLAERLSLSKRWIAFERDGRGSGCFLLISSDRCDSIFVFGGPGDVFFIMRPFLT
jgi:hypothetical protein